MMKTGILGGTFDPPHIGHTALARAAMDQLGLEEVIFVPANKNPLKSRQVSSAKDRMEMVRLALQDEVGLSASDIELTRGGVSYAVDTLEELKMVRPAQYWFICGADTVAGLAEWKNPERLVSLCRLAVVSRERQEAEPIVKGLKIEFQLALDIVEMESVEISSTQIRNAVELGKPVSQWLNPKVWEYIQKVGLYRK